MLFCVIMDKDRVMETAMAEDEVNEDKINTEGYKRDAQYQVDTLKGELFSAGGFNLTTNALTLNYSGDDWFGTAWAEHYTTLIHELHHHDNAWGGMYTYPVSAEQAYKINMHDEISANLAELVAMREEYLKSGDISVFDEKGSKFDFYKEAIENGKIEVNSQNVSKFNDEMGFMANGVRDMWERDRAESYIKQNSSNAKLFYDKSGKYGRYYDENYQRAVKKAYDIGGINFSDYMDRDVNIPEKGREALDAIKSRSNEISFDNNVKNEPINSLPPREPGWREHEDKDGSRFSPVQTKSIVDLRKPVINRPRGYVGAEQGQQVRSPSDHPEANRKVLVEKMQSQPSERTANNFEELRARFSADHERLQQVREKLGNGHEELSSESKLSEHNQASGKSLAEIIREKRFESATPSRPANTQPFSREAMQRAMSDRQSGR